MDAFYLRSVERGDAAVRLALRRWATIHDPAEFPEIAGRLELIVSAAQYGNARDAGTVAAGMLDVAPVANPSRVAGVASDGRALGGLLYSPAVHARTLIDAGMQDGDAMRQAGNVLGTIVKTQVADAARAAMSVTITSVDGAGWVRHVSPPCCQRCAVLAGKWFRWNHGFKRHFRCDCVHVPARGGEIPDGYTAGIDPGQIHDLTDGQRKALADGADLGQVVNAYRSKLHGRDKMMTTLEGTTRRGYAGQMRREVARQRKGAAPTKTGARLTPDAIYAHARSRDEAVQLLAENGYIMTARGAA